MAQPVTAFKQRRTRAFSLTLLATLLLAALMVVGSVARFPVALVSGMVLYGLMLFLTLFNARKKIPFIPLLKASTWLQLHVYIGLFSLILFGFHIGFSWPRGMIEIWLAVIFLVVCLSGFFGIFISRWLPKKMHLSGEAVTFEKIPQMKKELIQDIEAIVKEAESETRSSTLADFYLETLRPFFDYQPSLWYPFAPKSRFLKLQREAQNLTRYLNETEQAYLGDIQNALSTKQHLDFMRSANRLLRLWLFIHIPFTYSLLIIGLVHGILALLYGGAR